MASARLLMISGLLASVSAPALAQDATAAATPNAASDQQYSNQQSTETMGEIVVTATRQADTVNRVPLSITAASQTTLDRMGLKSADDLTRLAPALTIRRGLDSSANIAIRGIIATGGSQTTGVYLDDTPLQKRSAIGSANGNGTPLPYLFDLERVEVLRGPQGTLFGGQSLGGTVRFITPTPSLTDSSIYARAGGSVTKGGAPSGELGIAVGGPLIQDKLAARVSVYFNHTGGYIDHQNIYTGEKLQQNTNSSDGYSGRVTLLWQATPNLTIKPQFFGSYQKVNDADFYFDDLPQYTVGPITSPNTGTGFPPYTYPAHTYGPIDVPKYTSFLLNNYQRVNKLALPSLDIELDLGGPTLKSITSYIDERDSGSKEGGFDNAGNLLGGTGLVSELPYHTQTYNYGLNRHGWVQEVRLSSEANAKPFSYVFGAYYQSIKTDSDYKIYENLNELARVIRGSSVEAVYHFPLLPGGIAGNRHQNFVEKEYSVFGEVNYWVTDRFKLTAGARYAPNKFTFDGYYIGPLGGGNVPDPKLGNITHGSVKEHPITPKFGASFQIDPDNLIYATVAKGYREGGVNTIAQNTACNAAIAAYGGTPPEIYKSDTVWSYEAGAKLRFAGGKVQVNSSVFYIDWSNIQTNVPLPGCFTFVLNAAKAHSKGFDLQAQVRPFDGLTLNGAVGYTDARYVGDVLGPVSAINGSRARLINDGDYLPVSPWTVAVGAEYDWDVGDSQAYLRGDYTYNSAYKRTFGPGTTTYDPDIYGGDSTQIVNVRAGVRFEHVDLSLFADNLFNSTDAIDRIGGRAGCSDAACTTYLQYQRQFTRYTFRPRTIGLSLVYRR